MVHLQEYHNEDVGCTGDEDLAGRSLDPLGWRCQNCMFQNLVPQYGYVCLMCKVPCEEFRIKARAKSSSQKNCKGKIQQDSSSAHAPTTASSQLFGQGKTPSLDTPMEHRSQTLQPHRSLPEPVTIHRAASNAAIESLVTTTAFKPISSESKHQDKVVGSNQSSGSYTTMSPLFCTRENCYLEFETFTEYELHIDKYHKAFVRF
jgi:hypothetical protein